MLCFSCQLMVMRRNDWWWSQLLDIEIWKWWWNSSQTNSVWTLFQEQTDPNKEGSSGTLLSSLGKKVKPRNSHCLKSVGRVCLLVCWIKILLLLHCLHSLEVLEACLPRKRVHDMLHWLSQSAKQFYENKFKNSCLQSLLCLNRQMQTQYNNFWQISNFHLCNCQPYFKHKPILSWQTNEQ